MKRLPDPFSLDHHRRIGVLGVEEEVASTIVGIVFAFISTIKELSIEKLDANHGENKLENNQVFVSQFFESGIKHIYFLPVRKKVRFDFANKL